MQAEFYVCPPDPCEFRNLETAPPVQQWDMGEIKSKIPNRLRDLRIARGLSQEQVAERARTTHATISRLESLAQKLSDKWLRRLSAILDATPGQILGVELREPVTYAPVVEWGEVTALLRDNPTQIELAGRATIATNYARLSVFALRVERPFMNVIAPIGSHIVVDFSYRELVDGKYYLISNEADMMFRRYYASPEHFGAISTVQPPPAIVLPGPSVKILGRVVQVIHSL